MPVGDGGAVTDAELDEMERGMRAFQLDDDRAREEWDPAQCTIVLIAEVRRLRAAERLADAVLEVAGRWFPDGAPHDEYHEALDAYRKFKETP